MSKNDKDIIINGALVNPKEALALKTLCEIGDDKTVTQIGMALNDRIPDAELHSYFNRLTDRKLVERKVEPRTIEGRDFKRTSYSASEAAKDHFSGQLTP